MNLNKIKDAVNLAGSVASLTGISLLWLKTVTPQARLVIAVPVYLIVSLLSIGVIAVAYLLFRFGYILFFGGTTVPETKPSLAGQIAYTGLAAGLLLIGLGFVLYAIFFVGALYVREAPPI